MSEAHEKLKASALAIGFDPEWVTELITKFGNKAIELAISAVHLGFSKEWVMEVLTKLGPLVLELIMDIYGSFVKTKKLAAASGTTLSEANEAAWMEAVLDTVVRKFLLFALDKYGHQGVNLMVDLLIKAVAPKGDVIGETK